MYNKLFTKILDSSIWMESVQTRVVWITFLAAMNEDGFVPFASIQNVAHRSRVSEEEAKEAIKTLESPDTFSSGQEFEGRRIERVESGWIVLNSEKYKRIATAEHARQLTRDRVARHRAKQKETEPERPVTHGNVLVTISETETETDKRSTNAISPSVQENRTPQKPRRQKREAVPVTPLPDVPPALDVPEFRALWAAFLEYRASKRTPVSAVAASLQFEEFQSWGLATAIEALKTAVKAGWQSVRKPDGNNAKGGLNGIDRNQGNANGDFIASIGGHEVMAEKYRETLRRRRAAERQAELDAERAARESGGGGNGSAGVQDPSANAGADVPGVDLDPGQWGNREDDGCPGAMASNEAAG